MICVPDLAVSRLIGMDHQNKYEREQTGDDHKDALDVPSPLKTLLQKRARSSFSDFSTRTVQPSRMSYDPKDFAYKMSEWPPRKGRQQQQDDYDVNVPKTGLRDNLKYSPNQDIKRRWRSGCDFSRVTYRQFVQFLKTGVLCGRRGHRIRFGFSGRR